MPATKSLLRSINEWDDAIDILPPQSKSRKQIKRGAKDEEFDLLLSSATKSTKYVKGEERKYKGSPAKTEKKSKIHHLNAPVKVKARLPQITNYVTASASSSSSAVNRNTHAQFRLHIPKLPTHNIRRHTVSSFAKTVYSPAEEEPWSNDKSKKHLRINTNVKKSVASKSRPHRHPVKLGTGVSESSPKHQKKNTSLWKKISRTFAPNPEIKQTHSKPKKQSRTYVKSDLNLERALAREVSTSSLESLRLTPKALDFRSYHNIVPKSTPPPQIEEGEEATNTYSSSSSHSQTASVNSEKSLSPVLDSSTTNTSESNEEEEEEEEKDDSMSSSGPRVRRMSDDAQILKFQQVPEKKSIEVGCSLEKIAEFRGWDLQWEKNQILVHALGHVNDEELKSLYRGVIPLGLSSCLPAFFELDYIYIRFRLNEDYVHLNAPDTPIYEITDIKKNVIFRLILKRFRRRRGKSAIDIWKCEDLNGNEFLSVVSSTKKTCGEKKHLRVYCPLGFFVGSIEESSSMFRPTYKIFDEGGYTQLVVKSQDPQLPLIGSISWALHSTIQYTIDTMNGKPFGAMRADWDEYQGEPDFAIYFPKQIGLLSKLMLMVTSTLVFARFFRKKIRGREIYFLSSQRAAAGMKNGKRTKVF